jgi:hypothetical protein
LLIIDAARRCWIPALLAAGICVLPAPAQEPPDSIRVTDAQVTAFASLALNGITQEFPNKPANVMHSVADVRSPKQLHPAFYGNFDWHSSVHGHWILVRLLRLFPDSDVAAEIRATLMSQLTADLMIQEAAYFSEVRNRQFERMYGWAWLLQLARELHTWPDENAQEWRQNLRPLERVIVRRIKEYLPNLAFPIRVGTHTDSAFALAMELDYARTVGDSELETLVISKAKQFYLNDKDYPAHYEPSGHDFFSSGFNEADLMRRVLEPTVYSEWLNGFLPGLSENTLGPMMVPVQVADVTDGHLVHLAGLDFSRAWTMAGIAAALPVDDSRHTVLSNSIPAHEAAGLKYVNSGHYEGDHWLATFAVYYLTESGIRRR